MRQDKFSKTNLILYACGLIPVVWLGILIAPYINGGLVSIVNNLSVAFANPLNITFCEDSLKTVLILIVVYALLFIRGERPILDLKYDILKHPNVGLTTDGHGEPYIHGFSEYSVGNLTCSKSSQSETEDVEETTDEDANYIIISSEEIEDFLMNYKEEESNEE